MFFVAVRGEMIALHSSFARGILRHSKFVSTQLYPFLQSCHPSTQHWLLNSMPHLRRYLLQSGEPTLSRKSVSTVSLATPCPSFQPLRVLIRTAAQRNDIPAAVESLRVLESLSARAAALPHRSLLNVAYKFEVGDVLAHQTLGQLGVVAAKLPTCFESNEWIQNNLGSLNDPRMSAPWYLILVAHHNNVPQDFSRYGSEVTHVKVKKPTSIGLHRFLPLYFCGFDPETGRYIPRTSRKANTIPHSSFHLQNGDKLVGGAIATPEGLQVFGGDSGGSTWRHE